MSSFAQPKRSRLTAALMAALLVPAAQMAMAQENQAGDEEDTSAAQQQEAPEEASNLDRIVVTGSLIPQTEIETFTPVTVISAEDIQARGFQNVSDVLQQSSFANGSIQGSQASASFTQGAETISMFGLSPSYTKYLINGRPMADYPALYNGSDAFNNISGIPIELVDRIEILPGGQSSLYGSDAIAGVVNIILKKRMDGSVVSVRGGAYTNGGGDSFRISGATGFSAMDDRLNVLLGIQAEERDPIWGYQRDITEQYYQDGSSDPIASRDYLVYGYSDIANQGLGNYGYVFMDPADCGNVTGQFAGTTDLRTRPGSGQYCGSFYTPGYRTLLNGKEATQVYSHATFDLGGYHQLYGDVLLSREEVDYHIGSNYTWWGTGVEWGYYYDPEIDGLVNLQRAFAPEDMGGYENSMSIDESQSYSVTLGGKGRLGDWDYDAFVARVGYELDENGFARFADPINNYFQETVLGPQLGWDPYFGAYPVFSPDYAAFYQPMSPEDFNSFTGYITSRSETSDTMARVQLVNSALFSLPGGDAGLAVAVEGARQTWDYNPDPRLLTGEIWGTTAVAGGGERDRQAAVTELRLPLFDPLTITASGRYDNYDAVGAPSIGKGTYSLGVEYRPIKSLLFRGKVGTAFKAPTLPDQFQAMSGYYNFVTDYYSCQQLGYGPGDIDNCPAQYASRQYFGTTSGSTDLEPLNADVWNAGVVWAPTARFSISADYYSWDLQNEVGQQNADGLALREMYCRTGQEGYDINSPTCQDALSKITRNDTGQIVEIYTPKVNEAQQVLDAVSASVNYSMDIGKAGELFFRGSYTAVLDHEFVAFEGDEAVDLRRRPGWSSDPTSKANASVTWRRGDWSSTVYANRIGHTPNYRARVLDSYADPDAGKLAPHTIYNLSVSYRATEDLDLSVMVNNVLDEMPPEDHTYPGSSGAPYNGGQYNPYGRAIYLEARYAFGQD